MLKSMYEQALEEAENALTAGTILPATQRSLPKLER
ncbi:Uncharacterised protein [Vibrio cholerae]|nr:Uncharacterised protein [Vibrio cholerae]